jgi:Arc/MetJ-type ribon-helix-helix transcriptional regulator
MKIRRGGLSPAGQAGSSALVLHESAMLDAMRRAMYDPNMKTIAVTIDSDTIAAIDHLLSAPAGPWKSRSELVRQALQEFVREVERRREEEHETAVFRENRERLAAEARDLIADQAEL